MINGAKLGGATGAIAPLVFWSRSLKKSPKVSKSKSCSLEVAPADSTLVSLRANFNTLNVKSKRQGTTTQPLQC